MSNKLPTYGVNSPTSTPTRPEYTAKHADATGLDELLDSAGVFQITVMDGMGGGYEADIACGRGEGMIGYDKYRATGPTRMDALRNAVAQATATQEGTSDE